MLSFFRRDVLDEILDLIESVSEGFPIYSFIKVSHRGVPRTVKRFVNLRVAYTCHVKRTPG